MTDEDYEALIWGLVCLVAFVEALSALLQHPEWFN